MKMKLPRCDSAANLGLMAIIKKIPRLSSPPTPIFTSAPIFFFFFLEKKMHAVRDQLQH